MLIKKTLVLSLVVMALTGCASQGAPAVAAPAPVPAAPSRVATFADNPIVYFLITDRFLNGNPANDNSYGRQKDGDKEIGTFHGGDLAGITRKLNEGYFKQLGVNALWITAPYEQIHGWVQGGKAEFKHYAYHGYFALDYTQIDKNMGTPDELRTMIDTAHAQGIRVLFDVVMNHPGYLDIQTASEYAPKLLWKGWEKHTLKDYHSWIDYNNFAFKEWWGGDWVRAGLPGYSEGGRDDLTMQLAFLPDFRTESKKPVSLPVFMKRKADTKAVDLPNTTVRGYLVSWLSDWVREYGVDGFRCDTAKHVEREAWRELKTASAAALREWKVKHPDKKIDDAPFWMVGEVFPHGVDRDDYWDNGFDSLLNFDFQDQPLQDHAMLDRTYAGYSETLRRQHFDVLSYLSSHDTRLYRRERLFDATTALLLAPGGIQLFYGDETARPEGPASAGDPQQATRSDMNWQSLDATLLAHVQKLGQFRLRHPALAKGKHRKLSDTPYVFSRIDNEFADRVVVAPKVSGELSIPVDGVFKDGERVRDAYTGATATVSAGMVRLLASGAVLLEANK